VRILVADDDVTSRKMLETVLTTWGYEVITVSDGNEAWERLRAANAPKLAILDWMMPGMDGVRLCCKVREMNTVNPSYIIILSCRDKKEDVVQGLKAEANDYIVKPYNSDELRERLEVGRRAIESQATLVNTVRKQATENLWQQEQSKKTIAALEEQINELEKRASKADKEDGKTLSSETATSILDKIVFIFKRGEINLPSHPQISMKFNEMANRGADLQEIARLLKQDVAISAKLISVSNSAYYRGLTENKNLEQAVARLGLTTTRQYVDVVAHRALYTTKNKKFLELLDKLWEHSLSCAYASQATSKALKVELPDDAFTLGLLHDIGKLVLLQAVGELQDRGKLGKGVDEAELSNTIDTHHGKFGGALLKTWKFSSGYVQVATYHDNLGEADPISKELLVVHFANLLVKSMAYDLAEDTEVDLAEAASSRLLKLDSTMIAEIKTQTEELMEEMKGHFA
jgi:DNA-binding response OmpR family regulator